MIRDRIADIDPRTWMIGCLVAVILALMAWAFSRDSALPTRVAPTTAEAAPFRSGRAPAGEEVPF